MASLFELPQSSEKNEILRILDPGAGKGCLGFELAKRLIKIGHRVELFFIDNESILLFLAKTRSLARLRA